MYIKFYRHIRTNNLYKIVTVGRNVKTLEKEVVYKYIVYSI